MKYKIRIFNKSTNREVMTIDEVFESKDAAEVAIKSLKASLTDDHQYVKIPVQS